MTDELVLSHQVAVAKEIDGIEMGVLDDGTSYLSGRSLAKLCGVATSAIAMQANRWLSGDRSSKLAQLLVARGVRRPSLFIEVPGATKVHAYPDDICTAFLEYYAFDATPPSGTALANYRILTRAGLRTFVYTALGYDPSKRVPASWKHFHDRLELHTTPAGYFSVFREGADIVIAAIRAGLAVDEHTVPDISMGIGWAKHWEKQKLSERFGERRKAPHNYPDYFPQAASNPQAISIYPLDGLGEFRRWLQTTYLPEKFPTYLKGKVAEGAIAASTVELLLAEVGSIAPPALGT